MERAYGIFGDVRYERLGTVSVAKHFDLAIDEAAFSYPRKYDSIKAEAALDGIYIIRTSVPAAQMDAPDRKSVV